MVNEKEKPFKQTVEEWSREIGLGPEGQEPYLRRVNAFLSADLNSRLSYLIIELSKLNVQMQIASDAQSKHTKSIVRATWFLGGCTLALVLVTVALAYITWLSQAAP